MQFFPALLGMLLLALAGHARADTITVAVAANLQQAFGELQAEFGRQAAHKLVPVYGSSGKLVTQIANGAPFDLFLSADMDYPKKLEHDGLTVGSPRSFAFGTLVLWTMYDLDLFDWQRALAGPAVRKIAIANPKTAPYGRETMKALAQLKLDAVLQPKLVFGESIGQTSQYIRSRAAEAGFTAKSIVLSPDMKGQGKWIELPRDAYEPIAQGAVILLHGRQMHPEAAQQFFDFLFSPPARAVFQRYGYLLP